MKPAGTSHRLIIRHHKAAQLSNGITHQLRLVFSVKFILAITILLPSWRLPPHH
jgi:hypothetical protein